MHVSLVSFFCFFFLSFFAFFLSLSSLFSFFLFLVLDRSPFSARSSHSPPRRRHSLELQYSSRVSFLIAASYSKSVPWTFEFLRPGLTPLSRRVKHPLVAYRERYFNLCARREIAMGTFLTTEKFINSLRARCPRERNSSSWNSAFSFFFNVSRREKIPRTDVWHLVQVLDVTLEFYSIL